jgi:integrase
MIEQGLATENEALAHPLSDSEVALQNAIRLWTNQTTRPETNERDSQLSDKRQAVSRFFAFVDKHPGEVRPADVEAWRAHLESAGNKPATVYTRISRLSSFYRWLMADPQIGAYIGVNPTTQARPRFQRPYQSESVKAWSDDEMNALLTVIKRSADAGSVVGKRDYALLLFYLLTGLRRNEVISLRGKDLCIRPGTPARGLLPKRLAASLRRKKR